MSLSPKETETRIDATLDSESGPKWPTDPQSRRRRLEAVLFMARSPLPSRKLSQLAELEDGTQARTMIRELNQHRASVQRR